MKRGILVCGLNGSGKSTLGRALAEGIGSYFIDIEDLYFPDQSVDYKYAEPRSREEVCDDLLQKTEAHEDFVLAAVKGDYGSAFTERLTCIVLLDVPKDIRLERVRDRSYDLFGERALPGGDLYERESDFWEMASNRPENLVREWILTVGCQVTELDGTKPVEENLRILMEHEM